MANKKDDSLISTSSNTEVSEKMKKQPKMVSAKKLPKLLKKAYTEKQLAKMLKKVYINEDREFLSSLYTPVESAGKRAKVAISQELEFSKKDMTRLKEMAKAISHNKKTRFRFVPFAAAAIFIAVVGILVTAFKNPMTKLAIKTVMENIFEAKCDIGQVNVEIFGAQINVKNLAQANKDEPMKNIFQFDNLDLNFNLTQLLRGRFDAENIEIAGVAIGTERTTSGKLTGKLLKQKIAEQVDESGFYTSLKEKSGTALENAKENLVNAFAAYNPQNVAEDIKENFKSAETAKLVESEVQTMIATWKEKPAEIEKQVKDFQNAAESLAKLNVNNLNTPAQIQDALTKVSNAIQTGNSVKSNVESVTNSIQKDADKVKSLSTELTDAIAADKKLISDKFNMYASFDGDTAKGILASCLDSVAYDLLGKYYPYLKEATDYAGGMKNAGNGESSGAKKKGVTGRLYGRDVYWKADKVPTFLIERLAASGLGLEATATNISNDMDKRGEPMIAKGSYTTEKQVHNAGLTVDARTSSPNPLITADYSGNNYPFSMDMTKTVSADGVPSLAGITGISARLTANEDFGFSVSSLFNMNDVTVTAAALSNETADRLYQNALATIKDLTLGAKVGFSPSSGIDLDITSDLDKKLMGAMKSMASEAVTEASRVAMKKAQEELEKATGGASTKILEFAGITDSLNSSDGSVKALNAQLESKKKELASAAANAGKSAATDAAKNALKKLF